MRKPTIVEQDHRTIQIKVYSTENVVTAIAAILPEPKYGTREEWANMFYNTGVKSGAATIYAWYA